MAGAALAALPGCRLPAGGPRAVERDHTVAALGLGRPLALMIAEMQLAGTG